MLTPEIVQTLLDDAKKKLAGLEASLVRAQTTLTQIAEARLRVAGHVDALTHVLGEAVPAVPAAPAEEPEANA